MRALRYLMVLVFGAGICTLGIELTASRLLAPYFGTSQLIWANVIGLTLLYLTAGYTLGGRWADKRPELGLLCTIIVVAAIFSAIIPLLAAPILHWSLKAFANYSIGVFFGSLFGVLALFSIPITLLGMVSPFAIRLSIQTTEGAGKAAGNLYAISTLGSIIGTFLPVLVLIPFVGTNMTIYIFSAGLLIIAMPGLWITKRRSVLAVAAVALVAVLALAFVPSGGPIKEADCGGCTLLLEDDSAYNYIQVATRETSKGPLIGLILNEGKAIHSTYFPRFEETKNPADLLTDGPWDFYNVAPYVYPERDPQTIKSMAMIGSAAGSVPKQFLAIYGSDAIIDGVEIDPRIAELGREYFAMQDVEYYTQRGEKPQFPNFNTYITDGRVYFASTDRKYDIIGMDAYKQPYIPFHLTTQEFFMTVRDHLTPNGVAVVNAGRPKQDYRLANVLASTMSTVFPHVYMIDVPNGGNTMLIGTMTDVGDGVENFKGNLARITNPVLQEVMNDALSSHSTKFPLRRWAPEGETQVFTDDKAPVEWVIDQIILDVVNEGPQ